VIRKEVIEMFGMEESKGKSVWCLHCQRVFKYEGGMGCAYEGCDGWLWDLMEWEEFREWQKSGGIDTPEEPEEGVIYSLYPKNP